jgi:hypothetical protein
MVISTPAPGLVSSCGRKFPLACLPRTIYKGLSGAFRRIVLADVLLRQRRTFLIVPKIDRCLPYVVR